MNDVFELHEFFVEGRRKGESHVLLHISEPAIGEQQKGYFFALCEIRHGSIAQIEHLQQMIDEVETGYYTLPVQATPHPFETVLDTINKRSHHILGENPRSEIDCFLGVIQKETLLFAIHGNPVAHILYKKKDRWKHIDLLQQHEEHTTEPQLFSTITEGTLATGDYLFISTQEVTNHFSFDRIQKIIGNRNTESSALHIERVLEQLRSDSSFGGILFHRPKKEEIRKTGKQLKTMEAGSAASLQSLADQQRHTAETLSPPLAKKTKQMMSAMLSKKDQEPMSAPRPSIESNFRPRQQRKTKQHDPLGHIILVGAGKGIVFGLVGMVTLLKNILYLFSRFFVLLFLLITNYGRQRQQVISEIMHSIDAKKRYVQQLPLLSKILFLAMIACAVVFISSVSVVRTREAKEQEAIAYTERVQAIRDKKDAADASIIYGDTQKALTLLQEGRTLIDTLRQDTEEEKTLKQELEKQIEDILTTIQKLTTVRPQLIGTLTDTYTEAEATHMEKIGEALFLYGPDDHMHYTFNIITKQTTTQSHETIKSLRAATTPKEEDKIVFLSEGNSIAEFDPEANGVLAKDIAYPNSEAGLSDLIVYNRKLYTLAPSENQIYKHSQTQTGYDKGTPWIKTPGVTIENAISFAIDGDVFVLGQHGVISKFSAGIKQDFGVSGLEPKLENPTKIWTYNDVNEIYILEPTHKRVIVLDKNGALIEQYTAEEWNAPSDMVVDSNNNIIYVLDSGKIYSFIPG